MEGDKQLQKPQFIKIKDIQPMKHCYNVYGKVLSCKTSEKARFGSEKAKFIEGVIADESSSANFSIPEEMAGAIKEGAIIAIRNGRASLVNEHILLEIDRFGKVSAENVNIDKPNAAENISDIAWEKKAKN